jgi:hypothetical protein
MPGVGFESNIRRFILKLFKGERCPPILSFSRLPSNFSLDGGPHRL